MAKRWHQFVPGTAYNRDEVVASCEKHIQSGHLRTPGDAETSLDFIRRCPHERLVWTPFGKSWGLSPMNPNAWRTEAGEPIWEGGAVPKVVRAHRVSVPPRAHSLPAVHRHPVKSTTSGGRTVMYGDIEVPVLERNWEGQSMPYVWVINLKPGETWHHAKVTTKKLPTECYVQTPEGFIPPGALAARGLIVEGASLAFWTDCWQHHAVFMLPPPELSCVELTRELWDMLQKIKEAMGNRWSGLPDVIAVFPDGRIVMREMKFVGRDKRTHRLGRDKLTDKQHAFARVAESLFSSRIEFGVVEWGRDVAESDLTKRSSEPPPGACSHFG